MWLPCVAPLVRKNVRAAPNASAASRSARSYGVGDGPRSIPWMSCGTSAASPSSADRLAHAGIGAGAALVARDVVARRAAERVADDGVEVRRRRLLGGLLHPDARSYGLGRVAGVDGEILEAVAAEAPAMTELLAELVAARTLLGDEAAGQAVMRRAFAGMGLEPFEVPLDGAALERHPAGAPFGWDVAGKANVLADWHPAGAADGRSLILNGHIDVVSPEPVSLWTSDPYGARVEDEWMYGRGAGDMKSGLVAMIGAVRGLQRLGPRAARAGAAPVGRRGGVHGQRRARLRAGRAHGGRRDPDRADGRRDLERAGRRAVVPGARPRRARPCHGGGRGRQRDRGLATR